MADFEEILKDLKDKSLEVIKSTLKDYRNQAEQDVNDFLESSKEKLERWTRLLGQGELETDDFKWLVESQKDLLVLNGLKQAGLAEVKLEKFKNTIVNLVVDTIFEKVL